jgi:hypothetical protein
VANRNGNEPRCPCIKKRQGYVVRRSGIRADPWAKFKPTLGLSVTHHAAVHPAKDIAGGISSMSPADESL